MVKYGKFLIAILALTMSGLQTPISAQNSGSRKPGSSSSSSGSKPKFSAPSRPSTPPPKPKFSAPSKPSTPAPSKPKFSAPAPSKPSFSSPSKPPETSRPKFSAPVKPSAPTQPSTPQTTPKPKFSSPSTNSQKPPASGTQQTDGAKFSNPTVAPSNSRKPSTDGISDKARAAKEESSAKKFEASQAAKVATLPPKPKYTSPQGKTVNVNVNTRQVEHIRNQPASHYQPEVRHKTINVFVEKHYSHPYDYYYRRPTVYVGGGYSSAFWWMMAEWDAERRARWLYNNRNQIEADAYNRGVQDAEVQAYIRKLEQQNARPDPNYVDRDFAQDPSLMYTDEHINAVYNPAPVVPADPAASRMAFYMLGAIVLIVLAGLGVYVLCNIRIGN
jgi:hypothetical protein